MESRFYRKFRMSIPHVRTVSKHGPEYQFFVYNLSMLNAVSALKLISVFMAVFVEIAFSFN